MATKPARIHFDSAQSELFSTAPDTPAKTRHRPFADAARKNEAPLSRTNALGSLLGLMLLMTAPIAHSDVYRWVDEQGVTHFSDAPPAKGQSEKISVPVSTPDPEAEMRLNQMIRLQEQARQERLNKAQEQERQAAEKAARDEACRKAREQLQTLEAGPARMLITEPDGTQRWLAPDERLARIAAAQKRVSDTCDK